MVTQRNVRKYPAINGAGLEEFRQRHRLLVAQAAEVLGVTRNRYGAMTKLRKPIDMTVALLVRLYDAHPELLPYSRNWIEESFKRFGNGMKPGEFAVRSGRTLSAGQRWLNKKQPASGPVNRLHFALCHLSLPNNEVKALFEDVWKSEHDARGDVK